MTSADAEALRAILLEVVKTEPAQEGRQDAFGQRYRLDFELKWQNKEAVIRSGWIVEEGSTFPRLTTCYPL